MAIALTRTTGHRVKSTLEPQVAQALLRAELGDVFSILGMHATAEGLLVRVFLPDAAAVRILERGGEGLAYEANKTHSEGIFEASIVERRELFSYEIEIVDHLGVESRCRDPYSFWPQLASKDQYLFNEGTHHRAYDVLGAHPRRVDEIDGAYFAVWAPSATRVSVVGDFNHWDGRLHCMRPLGEAGLWEIFIPGLAEGAVYKFEILASEGDILLKSDPFAFAAEVPSKTASVLCRTDNFHWGDEAWMTERDEREWTMEPLAIYEVHPGSWRRNGEAYLDYRELAHQLVAHVEQLGFTHIELMSVAEHPFDGSWGYQVTGYYAPSARFGTPEDFAYFVDYCHCHSIGVILDWVPGHFPVDAHGLARFDGTGLYEHLDPRQGWHPDWQTLVFNYGRDEVRSFLLSNALFWLERYHIDGLRVDAVASMLYLDYSRKEGEWVPNAYGGRENLEAIEFLKQLNTAVYAHYPGAMVIAEESTSWPAVSKPVYAGGLGFGFKWNMGWMNDVLRYMQKEPVHRRYHQADLTFGMLYAYHENFVLPFSHDEVVHGKGSLVQKMPGDPWQKLANLRLLYGFMYGHPGKKLLFMGAEFAQWGEWNHEKQLEWDLLDDQAHRGVFDWLRNLNALYRERRVLHRTDTHPDGFEWIDCLDSEYSVVAFMRCGEGEQPLIFVCNFTSVPREGYRLGLAEAGPYREVLNSDAEIYRGSGVGNGGKVMSEPIPCHGRPHSALFRLPPLGVLILERLEL
jgi:1,4-alpha-glucan branching enzyme